MHEAHIELLCSVERVKYGPQACFEMSTLINVSDQEQTSKRFKALKTITSDQVPLRCVNNSTLARFVLVVTLMIVHY
jgi:hypothetical protein